MKVFVVDPIKDGELNRLKGEFLNLEITNKIDDAYDAEIIIGYHFSLKNELLEKFNNLKWIQLMSSGYDAIDIEYLKRRNIRLSNAKGAYSIPIAEYVLANLLYFEQNISFYKENMKKRVWDKSFIPEMLNKKQALIIGAGDIGKEIAKRLKGFDVSVVGYKRTLEEVEYFDLIINDLHILDSYIKTSDYIILAIPSNKNTYHFFDESRIKSLKPNAIFVNIARGDVVDEKALIKALESKSFKGAILDVFDKEPLEEESLLWSLENVIVTPHHSNKSVTNDHDLVSIFIKSIGEYLSNTKLHNEIIL